MSTLDAIELGGEVHKDRSVSTGAFSRNGHDSSYIMSAKKDVLKVPTLGHKRTNMQLRLSHPRWPKKKLQSSCLETA